MNEQQLADTAKALVAPSKGILAADESTPSANKRFAAVGVEQTEENRRRYRELLLTTPGAEAHLSGVIFYDETFWQNTSSGAPMREAIAEHGVIPGIKLDLGLDDLGGFPGEKISRGLDDLATRAAKYALSGAQFAKWRSVIAIGDGIPTDACIEANAFVLARYARICQDSGLVPIVEPEVLLDGVHTIADAEAAMTRTFDALFAAMAKYRVYLPGAILKTSMVVPGKDSGAAMDHADVATRTSRVLKEHVPTELGGVVFLSGGQTSDDAMNNLDAIAKMGPYPWGLTFSYSRALQDPVLKHWAAHPDDIAGAQERFRDRLEKAALARDGKLGGMATGDAFVSGSQDL